MPKTIWPATNPTVNSDTPMMPAVMLWLDTVKAPARPPASIHHRMPPALMPSRNARIPRRPAGVNAAMTVMSTRPEPNENAAARVLSSMR